MSERLLDTFTRLCQISSPTGRERDVADFVSGALGELGFEVLEDDSAERAGAGAGNLICRIPGSSSAWVALFAHLDTVPHDGPIEVEIRDGVFRSRGETILGADNKAAVAVLMELAARAAQSQPRTGIELVFTVAEEDGLRGAKELDTTLLRAPFGFVFDHASPIGEVITAAPTYNRVVAEFEGIEAHSGIRPEAGRSAIEAAATAIMAMDLGRLDEETTTNAGTIRGGSATNVVAGSCRLECEARSLDEAKAAQATQMLVDSCAEAASNAGVDVDVDVVEVFRGYRTPASSSALRIATQALEACGHPATRTATGGGSDANALIASGYECVLLANGTEANHTPNETVSAGALTAMVAICEAIVATAASTAGEAQAPC